MHAYIWPNGGRARRSQTTTLAQTRHADLLKKRCMRWVRTHALMEEGQEKLGEAI
jgi:hypothetical protein